MSKHLLDFYPDTFDYIVVDECHHAAAQTYKKIFSYFTPKFILGLSATPERTDGEDMLALFKNVAHKMDLETAVKKGILAPIRCIRVKTDIDFTEVRINGIKYNSQDLESKLFIPERNRLIADTYINCVNGKKTVIFCASVDHAIEIARLLSELGVCAAAVSARDKEKHREEILSEYENGSINVLCACDLLNEGWDSPKTEVLFMARPTMSKTIYMQQLGRGTRKSETKKELLVFDFIDNANMFNMPYSLHRLLNIAEYRPLDYVLTPDSKRKLDYDMRRRGEKPTEYLDIPINIEDYETIDLFNWQNEVKNMISQLEFVRMVDVEGETLSDYIRDGKIIPDMSIPMGTKRSFNYFNEETVKKYAKQYKWDLITAANITEKFFSFIDKMVMTLSYKPVLLKAVLKNIDEEGKVKISDIVNYFIDFYETRREEGLIVEKEISIFQQGNYGEKDVERVILSKPFKAFSSMRFLSRCKDVAYIEINPIIFKKLTEENIKHILDVCDEKLEYYYNRITK